MAMARTVVQTNNLKGLHQHFLAISVALLCFVVSSTGFSANDNRLRHVALSASSSESWNSIDRPERECKTRRKAISTLLSTTFFVETKSFSRAEAFFGSDNQDRRQLELCLVNVLRVLYWAQSVSTKLKSGNDEDAIKPVYMEARLGAKALLTKKIGGGANSKVYTLATLELRDCLKDATWYAGRKGSGRKADDLQTDLIESLAAIVEFDGLETTQDPSPRSSLMLSMYNTEKRVYVQRLLSERIVPTAQTYLNQFDADTRQTCERYIQSTYPNEVPLKASGNTKSTSTTNVEAPIA